MTPEHVVAAYLAEADGNFARALRSLAADALETERQFQAYGRGVSAGLLRLKPQVPVPLIRERVTLEPL